MKNKKIFISGDYTNPSWHPFEGVDKQLLSILENDYEVELSEHYESMNLEQMKSFDMIVLYTDHWADKSATVPSLAPDLTNYVASGGALFVIHFPGISYNSELAQMIGAAFKMHPPYRQIHYHPNSHHIIAARSSDFHIYDEPYMFTWDPQTKRDVFLEYEHQGHLIPAGWTVEFALGKVVYLAPGHNSESFKNDELRQIILNASAWLCN